MASIKLKFRPSSMTENEGKLYYQIIHGRRVRQLNTEYNLLPAEWDESQERIKIAGENGRRSYLRSIREQVGHETERLTRIIRSFENRGLPYAADDIIEEFDHYEREYTLFNFMKKLMEDFRQSRRERTSETYQAAMNSFRKFLAERELFPKKDIMIDCIDGKEMADYERWLRKRGVTANTISFYMRILRAVYNRAVDQGITENRSPFRHVYTGIDKTIKRALPIGIIKKIKCLDLNLTPRLDFARDMFLLSFMLRGMSFVDMAYLKKSDLIDGYITYRRRKTGQMLMIKWTDEMQHILHKYPENTSRYLLPIIKCDTLSERSVYRNTSYSINYHLKHIASMIGVSIPLTLYVARHSWASAAKSSGVPLSVISEGMGHVSENTTRIYLASFDSSVIDHANSMIISNL